MAEARGAQGLTLQDELAHLRARIGSSPEVWLWWGKDSNGECIKRATTNPGSWGERPGLEHWERIAVVCAIPVEEEGE